MMARLSAEPGDLVYIADHRRWLGGIRSVHTKITGVHKDEGVIHISKALVEEGMLLAKRRHRVEKIF